MTAWTELHDPHNPENRVAGGLSDVIKHTVYLCVLRELLGSQNAEQPSTIYECHAGRGMYRIPEGDPRQAQLAALEEGRVHEARHRLLRRLACGSHWYPGSAALVADLLEQTAPQTRHVLLEWSPETRAILRQVCDALSHRGEIIETCPTERFDGETFLVERVAKMKGRDVILLDPFALFRQERLDYRRERYWRLLKQWTAMPAHQRPSLLWFFSAPTTTSSVHLEHPKPAMNYRYEDFVTLLAEQPHLQIDFDYQFPCRMWVFASTEPLRSIAAQLTQRIDLLREAFLQEGSHRVELLG